MPKYDELEGRKTQLIRKALSGSLFLAPVGADAVDELTDSDGELQELPDDYFDGGWMTDDGMQFSRDTDSDEITSFGATEPTRTVLTSDTLTLEVAFQETNKQTISLFSSVDLSDLVPDADSGELKVEKPARPREKLYRLLALAVDENEDGEIYIARFLPRCKVTEFADQAFAKGDEAIEWGVTFQAQKDSDLGYSQVDLFGGPGWKAQLEDMGFDTDGGGSGES